MKKLLILSITSLLALPLFAAEQYSCDTPKRYCKQMNSCAEAKFYLKQCGLDRLDRDKDGIPCESLCRK